MTSYSIIFKEEAETDLADIYNYYEAQKRDLEYASSQF